VTTPAPQQQQPPPSGLDDPALDVAVAAALVAAGGAGVTVAGTIAALRTRFLLTTAAVTALHAVLGFVMQHPPPVTGVIGPASEQVARLNTARRTQFVLAASKRVMGAVRDARSVNKPAAGAVAGQVAREQKFYHLHQQAMWQRAAAAGKTDMAALEHGTLLGWLAVMDSRTSSACRAASGKNFYATRMPAIGFPGAVHPSCRCQPVAPWPGGRLLPGSGPRYARAA